jgi:single-strand DNA-binding protein
VSRRTRPPDRRRMTMFQVTNVTVTGFVTAEPKLRHTRDKTPVTTIRVGSTTRKVDRETGEWCDGDTSYFNVTCWRRLAVNAAASLRKGNPVLIKGRFHTRSWDDEGKTRTEIEIEAESVGHDLRQGWANFQRNPHVPPNIADDLADGEMARQGLTLGEPGEGRGFDDPGAVQAADGADDPLAPRDAPAFAGRDDMFDDEALADLARGETDGPAETQEVAPEPVPA